MNKKKLTLGEREHVSCKMKAMDIHLSEFCFPNLYFFREVHDYHVISLKENVFIQGLSYDKKRYLMPLHSPEEDKKPCFDRVMALLGSDEYDCLFPIPEEWLCCFPEEKFNRNYNENDSDYLFLTEKMATYPGKKMHKKRNLKNQFLNSYEPSAAPITQENKKDAFLLLELWQNTAKHVLETNDYGPCKEALEDMDGFGLSGYLFYADGKPVSFVLGEPLNDEVFTIHFAKADINYKGVYSFTFSRFCEEITNDYKYINMEQDLGKDGLRQTKRSYRPDLMAHKYRIELKL